ncbi:hypothetical protein H7F28_19350 [Brevibacterium sp. PAMC23299]|nr:hypothetical protein H7F28_19350 [Brevibacterium sp. PAMC23299]
MIGYATDLMASLQDSLKASPGIDVKNLLENFSEKLNLPFATISQENVEASMNREASKEKIAGGNKMKKGKGTYMLLPFLKSARLKKVGSIYQTFYT